MRVLIGLRRPWALLAGLLVCAALATGARAQETTEQRMKRDLAFLAGDETEGRGIETKGIEKAANYVAGQFKAAGLKPGGKNGSWFQPFTIRAMASLQPGSKVVLRGPQGQSIELEEGKQFAVLGFAAAGQAKAPLVFVGYGATAPRIDYDDFKGMDVKGKIVVLIRRVPRWDNLQEPFDSDRKDQHVALINKLNNAEQHGAAGVVLINDRSVAGDKLTNFRETSLGFASSSSVPAVQVQRQVLDAILLSSLGKGLPEIEKGIDRDLKPRSAVLRGWSAEIETKLERKTLQAKNVVGVVEGAGPLADEIVIVGAHYDHLGYGELGSLARGEDRKKIHHGADDNGSGSTSVLELARRFGARKDRQGRTLVFMTFSGEERGLLGSRHYCNQEPLFPLAKTVAMVNLDMVGRMRADDKTGKGKLIVEGVGTAKEFKGLIQKLNGKYGFQLSERDGGTGPSDHDSFYRKKIPVFFFWTGLHMDYHRPSDTYDKINYKDMARIADLATDVITQLATESKRPEYVEVASSFSILGPGNTPKLGITPAYDTDKKGLLVDAVSPGGPAAKGGLQAGDLIIAIGDQPITNINNYMGAMARQKRGQSVPVTVLRAEKKVTLQVTPQ